MNEHFWAFVWRFVFDDTLPNTLWIDNCRISMPNNETDA